MMNPSSRGAVPKGLLGMIGLVLAIELLAGRHDLDLTIPMDWQWRLASRGAEQRAPKAEVLCFGDSLVACGISPQVVEAGTGRRAYNLAIGGGPAPAHYFLLRRALRSGARPSAVLVDFLPQTMMLPLRHNGRFWPQLLTLREGVELCWTARDTSLLGAILVSKAFPSVLFRDEIRARVLAALRGQSHSQRAVNLGFRRHLLRNQGALIQNKNPHAEDPGQFNSWVYPVPWAREPINLIYLRKFLKLAAARDIPVFWLLPPVGPEIQARCEQSGATAPHTRFLRSVQAQFPEVTVLDGRHSGYTHAVLWDPIHLDRQGAAIFSADVAEVLRRVLAEKSTGARWIELPAYRERPVGVPLEDIGESLIAARLPEGRPH